MSSVDSSTSSGSRIREFGLYRHIDARTEEFLRLSRKRQIRQGCACAAASTAITVTVAIVVFFIYEFSLNSETNLENSFKSKWLSLMNATSENSSFDSTLAKSNIDRTTLKLLPLLIKAVKKNAFLEKLLEDHSTSSPPYERKDKDTTENSFEPNSFANTWFKMPTTKLFAIEYKSSPVVYFKNPTKNIEYYTKVRKIRDYKRVFNYVDKMISEKVYIRSTRPLHVEDTYPQMTEIPPTKKLASSKRTTHKPTTPTKVLSSKTPKIKHIDKAPMRCNCPKKFGELLQTILLNIQKIVPEISGKEAKVSECAKNKIKRPKIESISPKSQFLNTSQRVSTMKPTMSSTTISTTTKQTTTIHFIDPEKAIFSFETNLFKKLKKNPLDIFKTLHKQNFFEQTTPISGNIVKNNFKNSFQTTTLSNKFINRYRNIIHRKQFLRNPENNLIKTMKAPILNEIKYDDNKYSMPTSKDIPLDNKSKNKSDSELVGNKNKPILKRKNNEDKFIDRKFNLLDITNTDIIKNDSVITNLPHLNKIKVDDDTTRNNKATDKLNFQKSSNEIALVKRKPKEENKVENETEIKHRHFDSFHDTQMIALNNATILRDKKVISNAGEANNTSDIILNKVPIKNNETELNAKGEIPHLDAPKLSSHSYSKTPINYIKNATKSIEIKMPKTISNKPFSSKIENEIDINHVTKLHDKESSNSKNNIYQLIENNVRTLLNREHNIMNPKLFSNQPNTLQKQQKERNEMHLLNLNNDRRDLVEDDFYPGDFTEFMDSVTNKPEMNKSVIKEADYDLTWEHLANEPAPLLKSMIPEPKPLYLEFHKTDEKREERVDEDYNFNGNNIYDLVN